MAYYFQVGVQYVTLVMIGIASLVVVYMILNKGKIASENIGNFDRVAAIVWVGRPLLFLRSVVAILILSTAQLNPRNSGGIFHFEEGTLNWLTIIIASGETAWLTFVVQDIFSVFTKGYTKQYADFSSWAV